MKRAVAGTFGKDEMPEMCDQSVRQGFKVSSVDHSKRLVLQPGLINQANGSAYIETEQTKIACAVLVIHRLRMNTLSSSFLDMGHANPKMSHIMKKAN